MQNYVCARYGIIVNDMFSYEKDLKEGHKRVNYINILSRENSILLDEAAIKTRDEMEMLVIQRREAIVRIKNAGICISD